MQGHEKIIFRGLVAIVWADGRFAAEEREFLELLLGAFDATVEEAAELRQYAETPRSLDDVPLSELSPEDCRTLLDHAAVLACVDGELHDEELALLRALSARLAIGDAEADAIIEEARERAGAIDLAWHGQHG
jgi:tellurite resistance protein